MVLIEAMACVLRVVCTDLPGVQPWINANIPEKIAEYGVDSRKISCDYYIDDRAVSVQNFSDWREKYVQQGIGKEDVESSYIGDFEGAFG